MVLFIIWCRATGADCVIGNLLLNYIVDIFQQDSKEEIKKKKHAISEKQLSFECFLGTGFIPCSARLKKLVMILAHVLLGTRTVERTLSTGDHCCLTYQSLQRLLEGLWTWLSILQWKLQRLSEGFHHMKLKAFHHMNTDPQKGCRGQSMAVKARVTPMCIESLAPWSICTSSPPAGTPLKAAYLCWIVDWFSAAFTSMTSDMLT